MLLQEPCVPANKLLFWKLNIKEAAVSGTHAGSPQARLLKTDCFSEATVLCGQWQKTWQLSGVNEWNCGWKTALLEERKKQQPFSIDIFILKTQSLLAAPLEQLTLCCLCVYGVSINC